MNGSKDRKHSLGPQGSKIGVVGYLICCLLNPSKIEQKGIRKSVLPIMQL